MAARGLRLNLHPQRKEAGKCSYKDTANKCAAAGLVFQPMVMSAQGGMTPAMGAVLHSIAGAVATVEGCDPNTIKQDMFERLAIVIARANANSIKRRRVAGTTAASATHRYIAAAASLLEEPSGS